MDKVILPNNTLSRSLYGPFRMAFKKSRKSPELFRHGSIVIQGGSIISSAFNKDSIHAEVGAIKRLHPSKRHNLILWVVRSSWGGTKICNSKPCENCEKFMRENGVICCYYSTADGTIEKMEL